MQFEPVVPNPELVQEMLSMAAQPKNEPELNLPEVVLNVSYNQHFIAITAPICEREELLVRFGRRKPPFAA